MRMDGMAALAAGVCMVALATPAQAQERSFNIPAGNLRSALDAFGRQSGKPIIYKVDEIRGLRTKGYRGSAEPQAALDAILAGTGFTARVAGSGALAIVKARNAPVAAASQSASGEAAAGSAAAGETGADNEIVVTGTNIRGAVNKTIPIQAITRAQINRSGYSSVGQLFETLPQNFVGGESGASQTGLFGSGSLRETNLTGGTGVNLRGLGATSTLVLVDGQRLATTAGGTFVDVSQLPLTAIERVDIVADGSSAIYGADAVAGVVNFIFRKDFNGAETQFRSGFDTKGSSSEQQASQLLGRTWGSGSALASVQYRHQSALSAADRPFTATAATPNDLIPSADEFAIYANARQSLAPNLEIYGQGLLTDRQTRRGYTPISSGSLTDVKSNTLSFSSGAAFRPADGWQIDLVGSYSREKAHDRVTYSFGAPPGFTNGDVQDRSFFRTWSAEAKLAGSLLELPGGKLRLASGASYRKENFTTVIPYASLSSTFQRNVKAAYGELYSPIVSAENSFPLIRDLALSAAVRYDDYSDIGGTTNTRFGAVWSPFKQLKLRATRSTSFRAPSARQELAAAPGSQFILNFSFPSPGGGTQPVFLLTGSERSLAPERSKNVFLGGDFTPFSDGSLVIGVDYYRIDFRDRIVSPPFDFSALLQPGLYGSVIRPLGSDAEAAAFLQSEIANGATFFPVIPTGSTGVRNVINFRAQNAAKMRQSGFDLHATYQHQFNTGHLMANANFALINKILTSYDGASQSVDIVNTYGNPLGTRGRGSVGWSTDEIQLTGTVNYSGSYTNKSTVPATRVGAWTTADFSVQISPRAAQGFVFGITVLNAFDAKPPRAVNPIFPGVDFDVANASPLGRFVSIQVRKTW